MDMLNNCKTIYKLFIQSLYYVIGSTASSVSAIIVYCLPLRTIKEYRPAAGWTFRNKNIKV